MSSKIKIYEDGVVVSSGDWTNPIESGAIKVPETGETEGDPIQVSAKCDSGYETVEEDGKHATITPQGTSADKWQLAPDSAGSPGTWLAWGASMDVTSKIDATDTYFWVRAKAVAGEEPQNNTSVQIKIEAVVGAA